MAWIMDRGVIVLLTYLSHELFLTTAHGSLLSREFRCDAVQFTLTQNNLSRKVSNSHAS